MGVNRGGFVLVAMILALTINFASGQFWNLKGKPNNLNTPVTRTTTKTLRPRKTSNPLTLSK